MQATYQHKNKCETRDIAKFEVAEFNSGVEKVKSRFAEFNSRVDELKSGVEKVKSRLAEFNSRVEKVKSRFAEFNSRVDGVSSRVDCVSSRVEIGKSGVVELDPLSELATGRVRLRPSCCRRSGVSPPGLDHVTQ